MKLDGFQFFLLVGMTLASRESFLNSFREKMEKGFGGAVLIIYRRLVRSRLLTAKGDTEHRSPHGSGPWRWTESSPKPLECKETSPLSSLTSCRGSYVFTRSTSVLFRTLFLKERQDLDWSNRWATIETWHRSQTLDPRPLFFFKRSSLLVVAQQKRLPRQAPAEPWSVTAPQFLYSLHKSRGLLLNKRCGVNPSSEPFLLLLFS